MALYAALTFWLVVIMFAAWGVHRIWCGLVKPRAVNMVLLPGTLVAQLGHVLGLLLSGSSVQNTTLMGDDDKCEPKSETPEQTRVPILGPILVGLLPLVACAACLYAAARLWGGGVLGSLARGPDLHVPAALPTTLAGVWELLHATISLLEHMLSAVLATDLLNWPTILFLYLAVCLTVRMAPFKGNRRGAIGAIFLTAVGVSVVAALVPAVHDFVAVSSWPVLSFAVGMLLFLLLLSLLVKGLVGFVRILVRNE
jgi:hypothetical protein